jgi:hypothetical protein
MKTYKIIFIFAMVLFCSAVSAQKKPSQTKEQKQVELQKLLDSKTFVFNAETASPMGGSLVRLTSTYELTVNQDTLDSNLPYFGTAYRVEMGDTDSPLRFTSTDFDFDSKESRNGGTIMSFKLNSPSDPSSLTLSVSTSGYATLQVNSISRQSISFNGTISQIKERKKRRE